MLKNTFSITLVFTGIVLVLFYFALSSGWFGSPQGVGGNFCEDPGNSLILQPANSFSNIGFILSGISCAWILSHRTVNQTGFFFKHPFIPLFYCLITVLLGPCSMAMHATETRIGGLFEYLNLKKNRPVVQFKYAIFCSLSFLIAFFVWHFGWDGHCFCNPTSLFQWHGVWHLLCGLSTFFLFRYYISEEIPQ